MSSSWLRCLELSSGQAASSQIALADQMCGCLSPERLGGFSGRSIALAFLRPGEHPALDFGSRQAHPRAATDPDNRNSGNRRWCRVPGQDPFRLVHWFHERYPLSRNEDTPLEFIVSVRFWESRWQKLRIVSTCMPRAWAAGVAAAASAEECVMRMVTMMRSRRSGIDTEFRCSCCCHCCCDCG